MVAVADEDVGVPIEAVAVADKFPFVVLPPLFNIAWPDQD